MLWIAFDLLFCPRGPCLAQAARLRLALAVLVFVMVLSGGLVAGIRAGLLQYVPAP